MNKRNKISLLGYNEEEEENNPTLEHLKIQNEVKLIQLSNRTETLFHTVVEIHDELHASRQQLSQLQVLTEQVRGGLVSAMDRMKIVTQFNSGCNVGYLIAFNIGLLFILFYWFRK